MVAIPRSALTVVAPAPAMVSQKTSLESFGLPPKAYLALARTGAFPVAIVGKLRVASYEAVKGYLVTKAQQRPLAAVVPVTAGNDELDGLLAHVGARRAV